MEDYVIYNHPMRRGYQFISVVATMFCSSVDSWAQEPRVFGASDKRAIEQMYARYGEAYMTKDYSTLRDCVQAPFVVFTGGELQSLESLDAVVEYYRNSRESLEQRGYGRSEIFETRITPLTADRALISKAFRRYKKDGSLLEEQAAVYLVSRSSGAWKLRGVLRQESKYFGKTY